MASMSSDLARRIGLTIGCLLVFRFGTYISVPGIDATAWQGIFYRYSGALGPFDVLTGGAIGRLSIFALGIMPFVSASLLIQLVSIVWPALRALPKRGESGRRRLDVYTIVLTIVVATFEALGVAIALEGAGGVVVAPGAMFLLTTMLTLTGGVIFLVWLAGQITARGIGNGISLILAVGIVAELPAALAPAFELGRQGALSTGLLLAVIIMAVAVIAFIVFMERAQRRLLIQYPKRQVGNKMFEGQSSHLPLKLNTAAARRSILEKLRIMETDDTAIIRLDAMHAPCSQPNRTTPTVRPRRIGLRGNLSHNAGSWPTGPRKKL
jgi:preprotein translocase subunit SecY